MTSSSPTARSARRLLAAMVTALGLFALTPPTSAYATPDAGAYPHDACGSDSSFSVRTDEQERIFADPIAAPVPRVSPACSASTTSASSELAAIAVVLGALVGARQRERRARR